MSIGVVASQAFSPNKIAGLNLWHDYSDLATIIDSGGFVSQGGDKSGKGHNAVQLIGGRQPQTGINSIGGHNVLTFDGSDDLLDIPFSTELNPLAFTIFVVCRVTGGISSYRSPLTSRETAPNNRGYILYAANNNNWQFWVGTGSSWGGPMGGTRSVTLSESVIVTMTGTDGAQSLAINGDLVASQTSNYSVNTLFPTRIGAGATEGTGGFFLPGDVGEVILYDSILTGNKILGVENYLSPKWSIALS